MSVVVMRICSAFVSAVLGGIVGGWCGCSVSHAKTLEILLSFGALGIRNDVVTSI